MKKIATLIMLSLFTYAGFAQMTLASGTTMNVLSGTTMVVTGDLTANDAAIDLQGTLLLEGDLVNNTSALIDVASAGTFTFGGSSAQEITGNADAEFYGTTKIDNAVGVALTNTATGSSQTINGALQLADGQLALNEFDLMVVATDPTVSGPDTYVKTNGSGQLMRSVPADGSTYVFFPVGNNNANAVSMVNGSAGTTDVYGVRVVDNEPSNSSTSNFVDRSWVVTEETPGGSLLNMLVRWESTDELGSFNRDYCAVGLTNNAGSSYIRTAFMPAIDLTSFYMTSGEVFNDVGTFAVSSIDECADMTVFFKNSYGQLQAGGALEYRNGGGNPWTYASETIDGVFCVVTNREKVGLRMHNGPQQLKFGGVSTSEDFTFQTELVTVELRNGGVLGTDGGEVDYTSNGFHAFGTTGDAGLGIAQLEMLPVQFTFRMTLDDLKDSKTETISSSNNIITFDELDLKNATVGFGNDFLLATYPNPFNSNTRVAFTLDKDEEVNVSVFDMHGKLVKVIHDGVLPEGSHKLQWDASSIQNGVYVVRFTSNGKLFTKNVVKM